MVTNQDIGKARPAFLLALGRRHPPEKLLIDGEVACRVEIFKHDSWAATALYQSDERMFVCKFNRMQPIFGLPMGWLGKLLARREAHFLRLLEDISGIPKPRSVTDLQGGPLPHAAAHEFVPGIPASKLDRIPGDFFLRLEQLIAKLHRRGVAYVDLHKLENVLAGCFEQPYLLDFQISFHHRHGWISKQIFNRLAECDRYHLQKHRMRWQPEGWTMELDERLQRPPWIRLHRCNATPFRAMRRRFLVFIGVRKKFGEAATELAPEIGLRHTQQQQSQG